MKVHQQQNDGLPPELQPVKYEITDLGTVHRDELVAISVAKVEDQILKRLRAVNAELEKAEEDLSACDRRIEKAARADAEHGVAELLASLKKVTGKAEWHRGKPTYSASDGNYYEDTKRIHVHIYAHYRGSAERVMVGDALVVPRTLPRTNVRQRVELRVRATELKSKVNELHNKKFDLPRLERQLKAQIAVTTLSKTEQGREVLDMFDAASKQLQEHLGLTFDDEA